MMPHFSRAKRQNSATAFGQVRGGAFPYVVGNPLPGLGCEMVEGSGVEARQSSTALNALTVLTRALRRRLGCGRARCLRVRSGGVSRCLGGGPVDGATGGW